MRLQNQYASRGRVESLELNSLAGRVFLLSGLVPKIVKKFRAFLEKLKVHNHIHKSHTLGQTNPIHTLTSWCFQAHFMSPFAELRKAIFNSVMSVCLSTWNKSTSTWRIFTKFDIWEFFDNVSRKFKFHSNLARIRGSLLEDRYTFMKISFFSKWEIFRTKFWCKSKDAFEVRFPENCALCEIKWKLCYSEASYWWHFNTAQRICSLGAGQLQSAYRHALIEFNTYFFSIGTVITRTRRNFILHANCIYRIIFFRLQGMFSCQVNVWTFLRFMLLSLPTLSLFIRYL